MDRAKIIDGSEIGAGNAIVGLASSGFHSNGFSLIRRVVREAKLDLAKIYDGFDRPLGEILLEPTTIYSPLIRQLARVFHITGTAHITGGGFFDNIPRILPNGVQAVISRKNWSIPTIFRFIQHHGAIDDDEMLRVFNCGIGMVLIVPADEAEGVTQAIVAKGMEAQIIGTTRLRPEGKPPIIFE